MKKADVGSKKVSGLRPKYVRTPKNIGCNAPIMTTATTNIVTVTTLFHARVRIAFSYLAHLEEHSGHALAR
jgi:hypothetical protein